MTITHDALTRLCSGLSPPLSRYPERETTIIEMQHRILLLLSLSLVQRNTATMGIGRGYVDKVRAMGDDEKQELMLVF